MAILLSATLCGVLLKKYACGSCFCHILLCFMNCLFDPYPSGLLPWNWGNHMIAPVPVKQPWRIWVNGPHQIHSELIPKQNTTKQCAYFMGYTSQCCIGFVMFLWCTIGASAELVRGIMLDSFTNSTQTQTFYWSTLHRFRQYTVPLHSPNDRQFAAVTAVQGGCQWLLKNGENSYW